MEKSTPAMPPAPKQAPEAELSIADAMAYALDLHRQGHVGAAAQLYERILAIESQHVDAVHYLGVAYYELGHERQGVELVRRATSMNPGYADAHNNLGNMLRQQGQLREAQTTYRRALELLPDSADILNNLGTVLSATGHVEDAVESYRKALSVDPNHADAHYNLGHALMDLGEDKAALDAFHRALSLRPQHAGAYRQLGAMYCALGEPEQATQVYQKWLSIEPDNPEPAHLLAACTGVRVPERATDDYIRRTFDQFASSFDLVLHRLRYKAPEVVARAIGERVGAPANELEILDAGCGTGLGGPLLRPFAKRLVGVDLSEGMLASAAKRGSYDELVWDELTAHLERHPAAYDLIASMDTLVYFGDLARAGLGFAKALRPGGHLVFTVERSEPEEAPQGFRIFPHGRYGHTKGYVEDILTRSGFVDWRVEGTELRIEASKPVRGWVVSARWPGRASARA